MEQTRTSALNTVVNEKQREALFTLEERRYLRRKATGTFMVGLLTTLTALSVLILFIIVAYITISGIGGLNLAFFTDKPKPLGQAGGGIAQAILGTFEMLIVGAIIAIPIGVGTAIYMAEYGQGWLA